MMAPLCRELCDEKKKKGEAGDPEDREPAEEKTMMKCSKCSAELEDNAKFCSQCGAPVGDDYVQHEQAQTQYQSQPQGQPQGNAQSQTQGNTTYVYQRTNGFAIAGFVLSFFVAILGIIFSAIALKQISDRGEGGKGLAIAGLVLSIVWICVALVLLMAGACTLSSLYFWRF